MRNRVNTQLVHSKDLSFSHFYIVVKHRARLEYHRPAPALRAAIEVFGACRHGQVLHEEVVLSGRAACSIPVGLRAGLVAITKTKVSHTYDPRSASGLRWQNRSCAGYKFDDSDNSLDQWPIFGGDPINQLASGYRPVVNDILFL